MNILTFLTALRDKVPGNGQVVSVFLMGDEMRVRVDTEFGNHHLSITISKPAEMFLLLNDDNAETYYTAFGEEINSKISEWEIGEA